MLFILRHPLYWVALLDDLRAGWEFRLSPFSKLTSRGSPADITSENSLSQSGEQSEQRTLQPTSPWPPQQSQVGNYAKMALKTSLFGLAGLMPTDSILPRGIWTSITNGLPKDKQSLVT
jgi:hypothetical protein